MRTTIEIPETLYRRLKAHALKQGLTMKDVILQSLKEPAGSGRPRKKGRITDPPWISSRKPGTLDLTNDQIYEAIPFP